MREILFRGKRIDNGEWVFGSYAFEPRRKGAFGQIISDLDHERHYIVSKKNYEYWEIIPETVGQFTGTYDRNGKKIFEGDIVKTYNKYVAVIIFESGMFLVKCSGFAFTFTPYECTDIEVIGTIYDNPELLEVKE